MDLTRQSEGYPGNQTDPKRFSFIFANFSQPPLPPFLLHRSPQPPATSSAPTFSGVVTLPHLPPFRRHQTHPTAVTNLPPHPPPLLSLPPTSIFSDVAVVFAIRDATPTQFVDLLLATFLPPRTPTPPFARLHHPPLNLRATSAFPDHLHLWSPPTPATPASSTPTTARPPPRRPLLLRSLPTPRPSVPAAPADPPHPPPGPPFLSRRPPPNWTPPPARPSAGQPSDLRPPPRPLRRANSDSLLVYLISSRRPPPNRLPSNLCFLILHGFHARQISEGENFPLGQISRYIIQH